MACFEHGYFAASARTLRQLFLQIESVYSSVSKLLSCLIGFLIDLYEYIHLRALGTSYGVVPRSII
jgi:hypothetical protein